MDAIDNLNGSRVRHPATTFSWSYYGCTLKDALSYPPTCRNDPINKWVKIYLHKFGSTMYGLGTFNVLLELFEKEHSEYLDWIIINEHAYDDFSIAFTIEEPSHSKSLKAIEYAIKVKMNNMEVMT